MRATAVWADGQRGLGRWPLAVGDHFAAPDPGGWAWMDQAACRGVGTEEFFGRAARGRERCRRCPVIDACFWWAIVVEADLGYRFGIWGGVGPAVRARVARVTGVNYARARFAAVAVDWGQRSTEGRIPEMAGGRS